MKKDEIFKILLSFGRNRHILKYNKIYPSKHKTCTIDVENLKVYWIWLYLHN